MRVANRCLDQVRRRVQNETLGHRGRRDDPLYRIRKVLAPGDYGALRLVAGTVTFADTTVALNDLAAGDVVVQAWAQVTTAFNAGTTNVVTLGNGTTTADKFLAAADITEGTPGVYPTGGRGPFTAETTAGTLTAT